MRNQTMPHRDLREPCSQHFTFGDFIECGETWQAFHGEGRSLDNVPVDAATWEAIAALATTILDPVYDRFGAVSITYGLATSTLTRNIPGKIAPALDQHAGMERNRHGALICGRGGQACDFSVPGVSSLDVAQWIHETLPFDRLYLYGASRPLHVSHGPQGSKKVYAMIRRATRTVSREVRSHEWAILGDLLTVS